MRRSYWIALDNHYILWVASFGTGLFMGKLFPISHQISSFIYFLITGSILLASLAGPVYLFRNNTIPCGDIPDVKILLTVVLIPVLTMMVMGYLITESSAERPGTDLLYMIEGDAGSDFGIVTASGRVASHPVIKYGSLYFEMTIKNIEYKAKAGESMMAGGRAFIKGTGEKINIIIKRSDDLIIKRDDFIEVKGETGTSEGGSYIKASPGNIRFIGADDFTEKIFEFRRTFYNCINRTFYKYLSYRYAPIAEALILGNRTHIPSRLQDDFEQSGTAHLMAISGMHISFLVLILFIILGRSRSGLAAAAFIIILLAAYNLLLGAKASVLRASIWMIAAMIAGQWNRESNRPRILCISFILLLILYPLFIRDMGFWFSFAAMSGIVFIQPVLMKTSGNIPVVKKIVNNYLYRTLILTISIQITCGPLLLYYFRSLPLISPVSNICILPFFYALLLLLMISACFAIIWPPLGGVVLKVTPPLFKIITALTDFLSGPVFPVLRASNMVPVQLLIYYLVLLLILLLARRSLKKKNWS